MVLQTELTKGQQETFDSLLKYQDGTAERYRDFCLTSRGTKPRSKPRTLDYELVDQRTCSLCGTVFFKRQRESNRHFLARPGCSRGCSVRINKLNRSVIASESTNPQPKTSPSPRSPMPRVKQCALCDCNFYRGVGELAHNWRSRKTCSKECRSGLKSKNQRKTGEKSV